MLTNSRTLVTTANGRDGMRSLATRTRFGRPILTRIADVLDSWLERHHSRRDLVELDERLLRDIGVTRVEARRESAMPFWKS